MAAKPVRGGNAIPPKPAWAGSAAAKKAAAGAAKDAQSVAAHFPAVAPPPRPANKRNADELAAAAEGREEKKQKQNEEVKEVQVLRAADAEAKAALPGDVVIVKWRDISAGREADVYKSGIIVAEQQEGNDDNKRHRCTICQKKMSITSGTSTLRVRLSLRLF